MYDGSGPSIWRNFVSPDALRNMDDLEDAGELTPTLFGADPNSGEAGEGGEGGGADGDEDADGGRGDDDEQEVPTAVQESQVED